MNDKEASKRIKDAGITWEDMHEYTSHNLKRTTYTEEEVDGIIQKINAWKNRTKNEWEPKELKK